MIVAAAIKRGEEVYSLKRPKRHHHILHTLAALGLPTPVSGTQGFIDDKLGFVDRKQAAEIALAEGQVVKLHAPPWLFSEDLW